MATDGVPRALVMPAERASAATLSKPTICASAMVAMLSECARAVAAVTMPGYSPFSKLSGRVGLVGRCRSAWWVVVELGERGEDTAVAEGRAVERGVVGGGVDEGLEDGAGGAFGDGVVELRDAVVAAADQREDLAGVGVDGDERDLRIGDGAGLLAFGRLVLLADDVVDVVHADLDGLGGGALQIGIERGVDAEALVRERPGRRCAGRADRGRDRRSRGLRWRRRWAVARCEGLGLGAVGFGLR